MKRKIYNELLKWKNEWNGKTAILMENDGVTYLPLYMALCL